jgi:hypothetical protein
MYRKLDFLYMLPVTCIEIMFFYAGCWGVYRPGISGWFQHGAGFGQAQLVGDPAGEKGKAVSSLEGAVGEWVAIEPRTAMATTLRILCKE